jgi:hypothetical protein
MAIGLLTTLVFWTGLAKWTMCVWCLLVLNAAEVGTTKASEDVFVAVEVIIVLGLPWVKTSCSLELTMVVEYEIGGGRGGGGNDGGGGGSNDGPGDNDSIGESSSVNKSRKLSSNEGSLSSSKSCLEKPEATSSSCCTGCRGNSCKKNLLSDPATEVIKEEVETTIVEEAAEAEAAADFRCVDDVPLFCMLMISSSCRATGVKAWV